MSILIVCAIAASVLTVVVSKALGVEDPVMGGGMAGGIAVVGMMCVARVRSQQTDDLGD
ncbi:MAG: hypothetical protein MK074_02945 [Phycisphaerales bacterium]|nr:hypothetical protein [Phycisphaerales bacterium]